MDRIQNFSKSARKELAIELFFVLFSYFIKDERLRLILLVVGIVVTSLMVNAKPKEIGLVSSPIKILLEWVILAGSACFIIPVLWSLDRSPSDVFSILLIIISAVISLLPFIIFALRHRDDLLWFELFGLGWLAFFAGALIFFTAIEASCLLIPPFIVIVYMIVAAKKDGLWLTANMIASAAYIYFWQSYFTSDNTPTLLPLLIGSVTSAMITGLALVAIIEYDRHH